MSQPSILIIGGGVFGTSTAYHLALRGYENVTVVDRFEAPSKDSAATDLNKIVRAGYPNPLLAKLALEAMDIWKDPTSIFSGLFHETGWIMSGHAQTRGWLENTRQMAKRINKEDIEYMSVDQLRQKWPILTGEFPDWTNLFSPASGWVPSGQALLQMANAAQEIGVRYITGDAGHITKLWYNQDGSCGGAIAANDEIHQADLVVLATGANLASLVNGAKTEVIAQTSAICVIQLSPEEAENYRHFPVIEDFEQGIIFPADENNMIKICSSRLVSNYANQKFPGASTLHSLGDHPDDGCPTELEEELRQFLGDIFPELAKRPFIATKLCWDGMAPDLHFRICPYPDTKNLYIATAGSFHGFKFLPVIGSYVADLLEGKLDAKLQHLWRWKFGQVPADFIDPHPWPVRDLSELNGWRGRNAHVTSKLPWAWSRL